MNATREDQYRTDAWDMLSAYLPTEDIDVAEEAQVDEVDECSGAWVTVRVWVYNEEGEGS